MIENNFKRCLLIYLRPPSSVPNSKVIKSSANRLGRPKAALLFWFFGDFRCGALLFMVIRVIYKYKNR